jgi:predicted TIM-barrel fold metal-dependent hydrolase
MIIDVHVHLFEEKMWPKRFMDEVREVKKRTLTPEEYAKYSNVATVDMLIREMDEAGVDISVCLPIDFAFMCQQEAEIPIWKANEYVAEAQQKYPKRIIGFVGVDPIRPGAIDLLERGVKELGLKGVKIFPGWYYPNDERVLPFIKKVEELNIPILFHQGSDPHPLRIKFADPRYVDDLLLQFPKLNVIAAHCARGYDDLLLEMTVWRPGRIYVDLSAMQYEHVASPWHFLMRMRYLMDRVPNAVVTGTDWPFVRSAPNPSHKKWMEILRNLELPKGFLDMGMKQFTKEEKEKVLWKNAKSLLNL